MGTGQGWGRAEPSPRPGHPPCSASSLALPAEQLFAAASTQRCSFFGIKRALAHSCHNSNQRWLRVAQTWQAPRNEMHYLPRTEKDGDQNKADGIRETRRLTPSSNSVLSRLGVPQLLLEHQTMQVFTFRKPSDLLELTELPKGLYLLPPPTAATWQREELGPDTCVQGEGYLPAPRRRSGSGCSHHRCQKHELNRSVNFNQILMYCGCLNAGSV